MATLVLSTVGTILGGPVGSAIGALIGQSIDQQLLGGSSRGPRLGDLSVQTSSYGTQVPRIYGTMRVAGSVIWATDLTESSATSGAKGQPDTVFSYSVSFAVALSSRPISTIKRIWADGKLIRGDDGVFKVPTVFRFHDGSEDQAIDPLIGSAEGIESTPAYRGFALAVFENLELAEFGNRLPFLTFEVVADPGPSSVQAIVEDATARAIICDSIDQVDGYAAHGQSMRSAIEPLIDTFGIELVQNGETIRSPQSEFLQVDSVELGCSSTGESMPRLQREQESSTILPFALRVGYYDPERDFQAGEARATVGEQSQSEERRDLPAVLSAGSAKSLAERCLARRWARRDKLTLHLPPRYLPIEPGLRVELDVHPRTWTVERSTIDGFVAVMELRPSWGETVTLPADSGRMLQTVTPGIDQVAIALFNVPEGLEEGVSQPTLVLAASSPTPGWKRTIVEVSAGSRTMCVRTPARKSILGEALTALGLGTPGVVDEFSAVDIELIDADQWLTSCDQDDWLTGTNLAILGDEVIQFGDALPIGRGRFRLTRLIRGCADTHGKLAGHAIGERFLLLERDSISPVAAASWMKGSSVTAVAVGSRGPRRKATAIAARKDEVQIAAPASGTTIDAQARATIDQILEAMRAHGLIEP